MQQLDAKCDTTQSISRHSILEQWMTIDPFFVQNAELLTEMPS